MSFIVFNSFFFCLKTTARPPSLEVQDADNPSQAVKRRLTPEIKQKLAKVARLAVPESDY